MLIYLDEWPPETKWKSDTRLDVVPFDLSSRNIQRCLRSSMAVERSPPNRDILEPYLPINSARIECFVDHKVRRDDSSAGEYCN